MIRSLQGFRRMGDWIGGGMGWGVLYFVLVLLEVFYYGVEAFEAGEMSGVVRRTSGDY